ncbi:hypothetical protein PFICI_06389 [Pestalotiopsis fici W106-1]|uniref:Uncharacterized protein n=1 Tax=Pestalotiopsis fici (strain W106-1 / CGMCC3.15140) TaxID=1229662 RepID=W3X7M2_PESFW|nr:uncharacterized protein PFICI_06389 [Pestalotiopsis fici W106-1]ETS81387.1 hypothetical protein PFICI_06389 [Pestalotiopsis fici W106-1]
MPITILQPSLAREPAVHNHNSDSESDSEGGVDLDGDISMSRPTKRVRRTEAILTPGEVITEDPQWMRGHGTYTLPDPPQIVASVAGTLSKTNKLLSVRPLRARYTPEIGDLVVGRIVEVQARRWRVDVGSAVLAQLPLSAINLPGGIQRRRTETDELQIRTFFSEGEFLKYGKLRNGVFMAVSGTGGGGGVVRARRHAFTIEVAGSDSGNEKMDVILGVNGYIWIARHIEGEGAAAETSGPGITRIEENVGLNVYSSQNDPISLDTMREIARVRGVITALVEHGLRVDEEMVVKGYQEAVEMARTDGSNDNLWLGGENGKRLADALVGR